MSRRSSAMEGDGVFRWHVRRPVGSRIEGIANQLVSPRRPGEGRVHRPLRGGPGPATFLEAYEGLSLARPTLTRFRAGNGDSGALPRHYRGPKLGPLEEGEHMKYEAPEIRDFGGIGDHTFQTPGKGTKSPTPQALDKFGEFSHPIGS